MGVGGREEVVLLEGVDIVLLRCWLTGMVHSWIELRILGVLLLCHQSFLFVGGELITHLGKSFEGVELRSLLAIRKKRAHQRNAAFDLLMKNVYQY